MIYDVCVKKNSNAKFIYFYDAVTLHYIKDLDIY